MAVAAYTSSMPAARDVEKPGWWTPRRRTTALKAVVVVTAAAGAAVFSLHALGRDEGPKPPEGSFTSRPAPTKAAPRADKAAARPETAAPAAVSAPIAEDARPVLKTLGARRVRQRARLAKAPNAEGQAVATAGLVRAYRDAAGRIADLDGAARSAPYKRLVAALTATADAYAGLRRAIVAGDEARFDAKRKAILDGEAATVKATDANFG